MISARPMTEAEFDAFKGLSQASFAEDFAKGQGVSVPEALKNAGEQFGRLVSQGLNTPGQLFFEVIENSSSASVGYLWLGIQERMGRKVVSINDIFVRDASRGKGYGKALMQIVESEAKKPQAAQIRLHVFASNAVARQLYTSMGFEVSSLDMFKTVE